MANPPLGAAHRSALWSPATQSTARFFRAGTRAVKPSFCARTGRYGCGPALPWRRGAYDGRAAASGSATVQRARGETPSGTEQRSVTSHIAQTFAAATRQQSQALSHPRDRDLTAVDRVQHFHNHGDIVIVLARPMRLHLSA
jgi:hypothetical protein